MPFKPMDQKIPRNLPFPLGDMDSHLIHPFLGWPHSPSQMASQLIHAILHNYATKSQLVTMGCPTFTPKTAPSFLTIYTPSNTLIPRPTPLQTKCHPNPMIHFYCMMHYSVKCSLVIACCLSICLSVRLFVCDAGGSWPHRLKILENNCASN